jgi:protocatechuate 3,4-dioxygenase beta subunit
MSDDLMHDATRRRVIRTMLVAPVVLASPSFLANCGNSASAETLLSPTPACDDGDEDDPTLSQTEGPYFTPNSPERRSLIEAGVQGTSLVVTGSVLTRSCRPVANALLDFWQADGNGEYDNAGYRLRGHQFTGTDGTFRLETVVPGLYPGRTRHIHVKVQAPSQSILTTQLYFPGESRNASDGIFDLSLLMELSGTPSAREAGFNFVLNLA